MPRTDLALALCLAAVTALTRVPFRARLLPTWDAVQFALALSEYDVVSPGYLSAQHDGSVVSLGEREVLLPSSTRRLVWVVDHWNPRAPRPPGLRERALPHGRWLYVLDLDRRVVEHGGYRLTPVTAVARVR